jgi:intein/homing endonuclease
MRARHLDNFYAWREQMKKEGKVKSSYPPFPKNGDLAELIGVVLGDGHIDRFPRSESLTIAANSNNNGFIERYTHLMKMIFNKAPYVAQVSPHVQCTRIRIYENHISKRLGVPVGNRRHIVVRVPRWILQSRAYLIRYLRGLYEAEGSFCLHKPTGTYKFLFKNKNESLLRIVLRCIKLLGFHPHRSQYQIQISRKKEVYMIKELLQFRNY